jgi:hypothetical protein
MALATVAYRSRVRPSPAILAGFIASAAMLLAFTVAYGGAALLASAALGDHSAAAPLRPWLQGLTTNLLIDLARPNLYEAIGLYFAGGLAWAVVYAAVFEPRLGGPPWRRGLLFSLVPGLFSLVVFLPLVGGGLFGFELGAGPLPLLGNLFLHAVYGLVLAAMYGPFGDRAVDGGPGLLVGDDAWGMRQVEAAAARGLVGGLALGGLLGLAGVLAPHVAGEASLSGVHPQWFVLGGSLVGGSLGMLVGSLCGLPSDDPWT